jgi:exopolyphosphatase/guanosine-5'-triphosphate,3'-diphosphate pyrophosphatase
MNNMPLAIIDLGTNTFQILIAEPTPTGFRALHEESRAAKIGKGGISDGFITEAAIGRALDVLTHYRALTDAHGVPPDRVRPIATSAVRNARNRDEFAGRVLETTGFRLQIIDGPREAELIYRGVRLGTPLGAYTSLVMDIGGGSVEFILGNDQRIFWKQSFEIGAQRLLDRFVTADPIPPAQVGRLRDFLDDQLLPLTNAVHQYAPTGLVGSAGSFETLYEMFFLEKNGQPVPADWISGELPVAAFERLRGQLLTLPRAERLALPGMIELRVDLIVVGVCLIDFVLRRYGIDRIRVSTYALKEGVLAEML